jgi:iron complex outermembrane receptor protein
MKLFICAFLQLLLFHTVCAQNSVKGKIADNRTGELLIGATVKAGNQNTLAGLDGSFTIRNVVEGKQRFVFSFIGYQTIDTVILVTPKTFLNIKLKDASSTLGMVTVVGHADRESDSYAKRAERESLNVINVISAKAI